MLLTTTVFLDVMVDFNIRVVGCLFLSTNLVLCSQQQEILFHLNYKKSTFKVSKHSKVLKFVLRWNLTGYFGKDRICNPIDSSNNGYWGDCQKVSVTLRERIFVPQLAVIGRRCLRVDSETPRVFK